jgi:hypothetical protein
MKLQYFTILAYSPAKKDKKALYPGTGLILD